MVDTLLSQINAVASKITRACGFFWLDIGIYVYVDTQVHTYTFLCARHSLLHFIVRNSTMCVCICKMYMYHMYACMHMHGVRHVGRHLAKQTYYIMTRSCFMQTCAACTMIRKPSSQCFAYKEIRYHAIRILLFWHTKKFVSKKVCITYYVMFWFVRWSKDGQKISVECACAFQLEDICKKYANACGYLCTCVAICTYVRMYIYI